MAERVRVRVDGTWFEASSAENLVALLARLGRPARRSVTGEPRAALCGMGVCYECRVTVNGLPHRRACLIACRDGMEVWTDA